MVPASVKEVDDDGDDEVDDLVILESDETFPNLTVADPTTSLPSLSDVNVSSLLLVIDFVLPPSDVPQKGEIL